MAARRGRGEDSIHFDHRGGACKDTGDEGKRRHLQCTGRWVGVISLGRTGATRHRKKVSAQTKDAVKAKLRALHDELDDGIVSSVSYTVQRCATDYIAAGLPGRSAKTVSDAQDSLRPLVAAIGATKPLRELTAEHVYRALTELAATRSTRTLQIARNHLQRAIRRAQAAGRVRLNAAGLADLPPGNRPGRPSRSLTLAQAKSLIAAAESSSLHAYVVLSALTGIRSEEARALRWDHVSLDAKIPHVAVWRSVRSHGDVKTEKSRRTLGIDTVVADALRRRRKLQAADQLAAGSRWNDSGLVFTSALGTALDAHNVRREFRKIAKAAGLGSDWAPRDLRHTFVSLMSEGGVPVEEIARLVGHATSRTTELVYRKELRPVIQTGAEITGRLFA